MPILVLLVSHSQRVFAVVEGPGAAVSVVPVRRVPVFNALISLPLSLILKVDVRISDMIETERLCGFSASAEIENKGRRKDFYEP